MSEPKRLPGQEDDAEKAPRSVNLALIYGLILLALVVAIGLALLMTLPFYRHH